MTLLRSTLFIPFVALAVLRSASVSAADCTDDEQSTINSVYTDLTNNPACANLMSDPGAASLEYCESSDCTTELSTALGQLPNCTEEDMINRKIGLQAIIEYCTNVHEITDRLEPGQNGTESVASGASRGVLATGVLVAQLCAALYFFA